MSDKCSWCNVERGKGHLDICPSDLIERARNLKKSIVTALSQEIGYRIKNTKTGRYYDPNNYKGTPLGKLYSYRGITSLMGYIYNYFYQTKDDWKIFEYLVDDEISLIHSYKLENWDVWQKTIERRKSK